MDINTSGWPQANLLIVLIDVLKRTIGLIGDVQKRPWVSAALTQANHNWYISVSNRISMGYHCRQSNDLAWEHFFCRVVVDQGSMAQSRHSITLWRKRKQLSRTVVDGRRQETCDLQKIGHNMLSFGAQVRPGTERGVLQASVHGICKHFQHLQLEIRDLDRFKICAVWSLWTKVSSRRSSDSDSGNRVKLVTREILSIFFRFKTWVKR